MPSPFSIDANRRARASAIELEVGIARHQLHSIALANVSIAGDNGVTSSFESFSVNNVRTVSDTKRSFYTIHTRPINSIYRRVVEELMVEMHLLSVNVDFRYDPIYALGVVTSFDRFMQAYIPEQDKLSIFNALCQALGEEPHKYRQDAQRLEAFAKSASSDLVLWLSQLSLPTEAGDLQEHLVAIANNPSFKYSRLFSIGLFTLLESAGPDLVKDDKQRVEALQKICAALHLPEEKLQKDLELYRSNLEKMAQARIVIEDTLQAERKKREKRAQAKSAVATAPNGSNDETPSGS